MAAAFTVYKDNAGYWRWRLRSVGNHKIIADCGQGYASKSACLTGMALVKDEVHKALTYYQPPELEGQL